MIPCLSPRVEPLKSSFQGSSAAFVIGSLLYLCDVFDNKNIYFKSQLKIGLVSKKNILITQNSLELNVLKQILDNYLRDESKDGPKI